MQQHQYQITKTRRVHRARCSASFDFHGERFSLIYSANANFAAGLMCTWSQEWEKHTWEGYLNCSVVQCSFEISLGDELLVHDVTIPALLRDDCINGNWNSIAQNGRKLFLHLLLSLKRFGNEFSSGKRQFLSLFSRKTKTFEDSDEPIKRNLKNLVTWLEFINAMLVICFQTFHVHCQKYAKSFQQ